MKFYAALLAVLMVGIAVGQDSTGTGKYGPRRLHTTPTLNFPTIAQSRPVVQKKAKQETGTPYLFTIATNPGPKCEDIADKKLQLACYVRLVCEIYPQLNGCALDVPAIQETLTFDLVRGIDLATCGKYGGKLEKNSQICQRQESHWTCREKSRILEHDEQTPPKFWCRKVQQ